VAIATFLADKSALARLTHDVVAARLGPLIEAGLVATCGAVELEVLFSARNHKEYEIVRLDRSQGYERLPMPDEVWDRALEVQGELSNRGHLRAVAIPDLLVAATAERHGVTVIHYDADFDLIAGITEQRVEWIAPPGSLD
jgi:predicted nucleic acid-binding protein